MDDTKEGVPRAYSNDVPDIHDEKPTGKVVQEEAVHSVALAEAFQASKPSLWSKSMLKLYFIMGKKTALKACINYLTLPSHRLPRLHSERLRLFLDGRHQCNEELPGNIRPQW
jgi:hypothetical protein